MSSRTDCVYRSHIKHFIQVGEQPPHEPIKPPEASHILHVGRLSKETIKPAEAHYAVVAKSGNWLKSSLRKARRVHVP